MSKIPLYLKILLFVPIIGFVFLMHLAETIDEENNNMISSLIAMYQVLWILFLSSFLMSIFIS
jgi:hypothetical protein